MNAILNADSYALNLHALLPLATALVALGLGSFLSIREGVSRALVPFLLLSLSLLVWMTCSTFMYLAVGEPVAYFWSKLGTIGVVSVPASALYFFVSVIDKRDELKLQTALAWLGTLAFVVMLFATDSVVSGVGQYAWGYYPIYGPAGYAFVAFNVLVLGGSLLLLLKAHKSSRIGSANRERVRLMILGLIVATFASVDFLATLGIGVYPVGAAFLMITFALLGYIILHYHLVEITPALASEKIIDTISDALVVLDENGIIRLTNPAAERLLEQSAADLVGQALPSGFDDEIIGNIRERLLNGENVEDREIAFRDKNGKLRVLTLSASTLKKREHVLALIYVLCDITEQKKAEQKVRFLAYNDPLTRLPNRVRLDELFERMLDDAKKNGDTVTVLFVDLDRFKRINDTLGHNAGDKLLCDVSDRLKSCVRGQSQSSSSNRKSDGVIARIGGDEFAVTLIGVERIWDIRNVSTRILDAMSQPFKLGGQEVFIGASIGISQFPRDGDDAKTLLKHADTAMYHAKDAGRNTFHFYNSSMTAETVDRLDLELDLRRALERNEFELHYQPQIDIRSGQVIGAEALLRWKHATRGFVSPAEFIPLAEESGVICSIGQWVLDEACRQLGAWHQAGFGDLRVAVNLSERQFRQNIVLDVSKALSRAGIDANALELELTEGIIMRNADQTITRLEELKAMGCTISVDDFGTGYSSLSYLKRFPIDIIKIDRSFVREITTDQDDEAITQAIISMAHNLKRDVIAEGVETSDQASVLRREGCHLMQGYLFARPLPSDEFLVFLQSHQTAEVRALKAG